VGPSFGAALFHDQLVICRTAAAGRWYAMADEPFLRRDYSAWWLLPPARWPRALLGLIGLVIALSLAAGLQMPPGGGGEVRRHTIGKAD
jgi:hypothetical protein